MHQWQREMQSAIKSPKDLQDFFQESFAETPYPIFIPKWFAGKIKASGKNSALWNQFLPHHGELAPQGLLDPIGDEIHQVKGQLIHRYGNRVLFLPTTRCPIICRYCFRKNELYDPIELFKSELDEVAQYLREHSEINEVIFSGGDPLTLSDSKLASCMEAFANIPTIKFIRFHTRFPIIIPSRINEQFVEMIEHFTSLNKKVLIVIHTNHSQELSPEFFKAIERLTCSKNVEVLSQSVLLKGVNDSEEDLAQLFVQLSGANIRPYYLHHPDNVKGAQHFILSQEEGSLIYDNLRQLLSGWQIPQYIKERDYGRGKVPAFITPKL